jgi:hypothetical protein
VGKCFRELLAWLGRPTLVEFDYRDATGLHHGCCYVRRFFSGNRRVRRLMSSCGYINIRIL